MNQRTRKLMTMHKVLHPRNDVDRLYVLKKEGGRGLTSIQSSNNVSIQWQEDCIKSVKEDWLQWRETIQTIQASTEQK